MKRLFKHFLTFCFVCSAASLTFVFNPLLILTAQFPFELYNGDFFGLAFGVSIGVAAGFGGFVAQRPWRDSRSLYKRWRGITAVAALAAGAVSGIGFWGEVWVYSHAFFPFWWDQPAGHLALTVAILCVLIGYVLTNKNQAGSP